MIQRTDRVSSIIGRDETLIDVFVAVSPAFERLRNPLMRRVMAKLVTVEQAARMGGVDADELVERLNDHAGHIVARGNEEKVTKQAESTPHAGTRPPALRAVPDEAVVMLDVRDELRAGREPFSIIMSGLREVRDGGALCVRAIFEPVPLYTVMKRQGLAHWTEQRADDDWLVWFYSETVPPASASPDVPAPAEAATTEPDEAADDVVILDVRGLEPPEPMVRTLAALEALPPGATLVQLNVRVPQFLLPVLEERGFTYEVREQDSDLVRMFIRRSES